MPESEETKTANGRKRMSRTERSRQIWEQVEVAVRDLAIRRGWPHETLDDLDQAVRRLDEEYPGRDNAFRWGFLASQTLRDNVQLDYMEMWEIKSGQEMVEKYIEQINSAH